jgi:DNA repair exonuclease SbcCD ATPase subunit
MKLKKLEVNSFAGINPQSPVVLDFTNSKWITASGDNAVGKTSLLNAMLVACGMLSKDNKDFVNQDSNKIDIDFSFVGKDNCSYEVKVTKSSFKLMYEGVAQPEPITKMKELLGVVGTSPMEIKHKPLKDIIRWIAQYSNKSPEEFERQLLKLKDGIKKSKDNRAAANKIAKAMKEYLEAEQMYNDWEKSEKTYAEEPDLKQLSAQLKSAGDKSDKYIRAEEKLKQLTQQRPGIVSEIDRLKKQLEEKEEQLAEHDKSISSGAKYLEDNKADKKEYDEVKKKYDNAAIDLADYNKWQEIKAKKSDMDEAEDLSQKADAKEKELLQEVKDLQAEILPNIKGMEIVTEDTTEDGVAKKEGLYRDGKNVNQLSETEWVETIVEIWRKYKVKVVVLDNIGSLGSKGVSVLEKLNNDGCHVLAAEMNRSQKELQISYE